MLVTFGCGGTPAPSSPSTSSPGASLAVTGPGRSTNVTATWSCVTHGVGCPARLGQLTPGSAALTAPGAPGNLMASVNGSTVTLVWLGPASGDQVTSFLIEAGSAPGASNLAVFDTGTAGAGFTATSVVAGTYYVRVRANNGAGTSGPSNEVVVIVAAGPCTGPPPPPAALRFTRVGTQLIMEWNPAAGASEYVIEAGSVSGGNDIYVGSAGLNTTFTAIIPESTHAYVRVYARNACGTSLRGDEIEIGALWSVSFPALAGLNANACVPDIAPGGLCSQVVQLRSFGQFEEIWSPGTPVMRVRGVMTSIQFTATVECLNGAASGTLQATWNGERYVGTGTLGGSSTSMKVTPGNYDPQCLR